MDLSGTGVSGGMHTERSSITAEVQIVENDREQPKSGVHFMGTTVKEFRDNPITALGRDPNY